MSTMYGRHEIHTLRKVTDEKNERGGKKSYKRCLQKADRLQKKGISSRYYHGIFRRECIQSRAGDGWGRECVTKGLKEAHSGIRCVDNYQARGRKKKKTLSSVSKKT